MRDAWDIEDDEFVAMSSGIRGKSGKIRMVEWGLSNDCFLQMSR